MDTKLARMDPNVPRAAVQLAMGIAALEQRRNAYGGHSASYVDLGLWGFPGQAPTVKSLVPK